MLVADVRGFGIGPSPANACTSKHYAPEPNPYALNPRFLKPGGTGRFSKPTYDRSWMVSGYTPVGHGCGGASFVPFALGAEAWEQLPHEAAVDAVNDDRRRSVPPR